MAIGAFLTVQPLAELITETNQIAETMEVSELVDKTLAYCMKLTGARSGLFFLVDTGANQLIVQSNQGEAGGIKLVRKHLDINPSLPGECLGSHKSMLVYDFTCPGADLRLAADMEEFIGHPIQNPISLPLTEH